MILKLKENLKERGMSSAQLAAMLGVSPVTVSNWVTGKTFPSPEALELMAGALDVEVWRLFVEPGEPHGGLRCPHCGRTLNVHID